MISLLDDKFGKNCNDFQKFDNSSVYDMVCVENMVTITKTKDSNEFMENAKTKRGLKYEIPDFTIDHSEPTAKKGNNKKSFKKS